MKKQAILKNRLVVITLIMIILLFVGYLCWHEYTLQQIDLNAVTNCDKMIPKDIQTWESSYIEGTERLSFTRKETFLHDKKKVYGFMTELEIDEPTMVTQYVADNIGMEHVKFGIYRDRNLEKPIDEADIGYNLKAWWDFEEGGNLEDYPDYKPYLRMALDPGTYYAAVFTTEKDDTFPLTYTSWSCAIKDEIALRDGEPEEFLGDANTETYFRLEIDSTGKIYMSHLGFAGKLTLCNSEKKAISEEIMVPVEQRNMDIAFDVKKKGVYYLRVSDYSEEYSKKYTDTATLFLNAIGYEFEENK